MIARKNDWFIPRAPPISALIDAMSINMRVDVFESKNMITAKGASFCQVDKMKAEFQEIDIMTEGYHAWQGAIPDLIMIENRIIGYARSLIGEVEYIHTLPIISSLDPRACTSRYLIHASVSWEFVEENIIGIKDNIFSSRANHSMINFF